MNSLGFDKLPSETRVVVAMSGGVDSSVVAALLHEQGYDVVGVTLQLYDYGEALKKKGACCAGQDIYDAKRVAEALGFPHYVLNYESNFRDSVIEDFADSYLRGETPVPCVKCNQSVKFRDLLAVARDLGADCMATGHYVQRIIGADGRAELHRAVDAGKDQSYFLFATTQEQLDFLRFPLGGWSKDVTRNHAQRLGLITADKPDSQDICFVPQGDYAKVVRAIRPEASKAGDIVHLDGRILGRHEGTVGYTIGQRKGLGIGGGHNDANDPFYVVRIDASKNQVIVGAKEDLARDVLMVRECNWLVEDRGLANRGLDVSGSAVSLSSSPLTASPLTASPLTASPLTASPLTASPLTASPLTASPLTASPLTASPLTASPLTASPLTASPLTASPLTASPLTANIKFRSTMQPILAQVTRHGDGTAEILLDAPQYGIAPGQAAVMYAGDRVLGGGWIAQTAKKSA